MPKQTVKRINKAQIIGIVGAIFTVVFGITVLKLAGTPIPAATAAQAWGVMVEHGYTPIDGTQIYIENNPSMANDIKRNITVDQDGKRFEFFIFSESKVAMRAYDSLNRKLSETERKYPTTNVETGGSRANFIYHGIKAGGEYYYLMRIDNTVVYAYGDEKYAGELYSMAKELGYIWKN